MTIEVKNDGMLGRTNENTLHIELMKLQQENQELKKQFEELKDNWNTLKEWCTERYDYMTFKMEELEKRWNK